MESLLWAILKFLGVTKKHPGWDFVAILTGERLAHFALPRVRVSLQRRRSNDWPRTQATVKSGKAAVANRWWAPRTAAELAYIYSVDGLRYSGSYKWRVKDGHLARQEVDRLKGQSLVVRYNRAKPGISLVTEDDNGWLQLP